MCAPSMSRPAPSCPCTPTSAIPTSWRTLPLILRCYPGEGAWEHYRDNGRDYAYQDGAYTLYRFTQDAAGLHQELVRNGYRTYPEIRVERVGE